MRKGLLIALTFTLVSLPTWASGRHYRGGSNVRSCADMNVNFDDRETYADQEEFTLPSGQLDVMAAKNGGVSLLRTDGNQYEVQVCKYAAGDSKEEAEQVLKQIQAVKEAGKLSVRGPEGDHDWSASLIIRVPAGASMNVQAHNGPISAKDLNGTFNLNTVNGPISVKNVAGKVMAKAKNGPISFTGDGGDLNLETQNGPISINLQSQSWQNGKLDASAHNGPVSLHIPKGYQSGVVLTSRGYAPMSCDSSVCGEARKTWDDNEKRIEFGSSNPVIHISTQNGPVSVGARESEGEL